MRVPPERIAGVILAGGASTRMGRDKSLIRLNGRTMIEHVIAAMRPVCGSLSIVADNAEMFGFTGLPVIPDRIKNAGPLGGLHAALATLDVPEILSSPCDTPLISSQVLQHLCDTADGASACVVRAADGLHPLCGVYRRSALPVMEECLANGRFKLVDALERIGTSFIDIAPGLPFYHADLFLNVNDPESLARITELLPK